ncbi:MAG: 1-phosphofructokinase family hexose kinase [Sphingobium sp.]
MTKPVLTLTLNPAIDGACETDVVRHTNKLRTSNERYEAGGGGINVSRVLARLGSPTLACYLAGGFTGQLLDRLIDRAGLPCLSIPIGDATRIAHAVYERSTGREYRFVPEGPHVREQEWRAALDRISAADFAILVASGSLAPELPEDFYARLQDVVEAKGARMVLDSSGAALARAVEEGGLWLMKPSRGEFEALIGRACADMDDLGQTAQALVHKGVAEMIVVTLGHEGALLAHAGGTLYRMPPEVPVKSAVGAGDSFVAGMTHRLAQGWTPERAFLYGMAAGTAAVLTPGTDLCHREDVERLFAELEKTG